MRVPVSPPIARSSAAGVVMRTSWPPRSRKRIAASTLGPMDPLGNSPASRYAARLVDRHPIDPALVRLAEVDRDALHAGRQHQERDVQTGREQGRRPILVDDRLDAAVLAGRGLDDGDATAADGDDDVAGVDEGTDRFAFHDPQRLR